MKQFNYLAVDVSGKTVQGAMEAATENDLIVRLSGQGLRVQKISTGALPAPPVQQRTVAPVAVAPKITPVSQPVVSAKVSAGPIKTRKATYQNIDFLFAQLGSLLHSGINATEALNQLATRQHIPWLQEVCRTMSRMTAEGKTIAEAMACFPDVFTKGHIGAIRASEAGGYVWQACEAISEQARDSHRMRWAVRFFRWAMLLGIFSIPLTFVATQSLEHSIAGMSGLPGYIQGIGLALAGALGVCLFVMFVTYWVSATIMRQTKMRPLRHKLGTMFPFFGKRSKMESLCSFNWHLSHLSVAGIAPSTAWGLAASAIPNEFYSEKMEAIGRRSFDKSRLSDLVHESGIYPPEYEGLIGTAEIAGSLPAALEQASRLARESMKASDKHSKISLYGAYLAVFMFITVLCGASFFTGYFNSLYKHTVGETEE